MKSSMTPASSEKKKDSGTLQIVVNPSTSLAVVAPKTIELYGLKEALTDANNIIPRPRFNVSNVVIGASAATSMATEIASLVVEGPGTMTNYTLVGTTGNALLSTGMQIYNYYKEHTAIQELQKRFLLSILDQIENCCFIDPKNGRTDLAMPYSIDSIMDFLYKNGMTKFSLKIPGTEFILMDNSFSTRVGKPLAGAVGATAVTTFLSIGWRLAGLIEQNSPGEIFLRITSVVAPNIPFTNLANVLVKWRDHQEATILKAMNTVLQNVYLSKNQLHNVPLKFLDTFGYFLSEEDMEKNRALREQSIQEHHARELQNQSQKLGDKKPAQHTLPKLKT